jgi:hypothetical protein
MSTDVQQQENRINKRPAGVEGNVAKLLQPCNNGLNQPVLNRKIHSVMRQAHFSAEGTLQKF